MARRAPVRGRVACCWVQVADHFALTLALTKNDSSTGGLIYLCIDLKETMRIWAC